MTLTSHKDSWNDAHKRLGSPKKARPDFNKRSKIERLSKFADEAIDNGDASLIDLGEMNLESVPVALLDLRHLVTIENGRVQSGVRVSLQRNRLTAQGITLLWSVINMTYLDLSGNDLTDLPCDIGRLVNLEVLIVRNNQLRTLPGQLLRLEKLERINAFPNPFVSRSTKVIPTLGKTCTDLVDLSSRSLTSNHELTKLPNHLLTMIENSRNFNQCFTCQGHFLRPYSNRLIWKSYQFEGLPFTQNFCSLKCQNLSLALAE